MGVEFNFDEDAFREQIADAVEERFIEYVENEAGNGDIECDSCGSRSFDVETWQNGNGDWEGAAVCRDCNERVPVELDTSEIDDIR
jgi:hypothetical protein